MEEAYIIVINHFNNYRYAVYGYTGPNMWIPVSRRNLRYGNAQNVSMFSQPLIDFCRQHNIGHTVLDIDENVLESFAGKP